jgi:hypothetical protein
MAPRVSHLDSCDRLQRCHASSEVHPVFTARTSRIAKADNELMTEIRVWYPLESSITYFGVKMGVLRWFAIVL